MNEELRSRLRELCKKHDGTTSHDLLLATIAAKLEITNVMLMKLTHKDDKESMRKDFKQYEDSFVDFVDVYLSLLQVEDPTKRP